jgi:hypothetical protein
VRFEQPAYGLVVVFDTWKVKVTVPIQFAGKLNGLCGNFDGIPENDLTTADGVLISSDDINLFGDSYFAPGPFATSASRYVMFKHCYLTDAPLNGNRFHCYF